MKNLLLILFLTCATTVWSLEDGLQICRFPDGKKAMLALTFDDILDDQVKYAPAILDKYGFKATFFMIPDRLGKRGRYNFARLEDILPLVKAGHEIGNHSLNHGRVLELYGKEDFRSLEHIVIGGQQKIFELTGVKPQSFCYPGNRRSEETDKWVLQSHLVLTTRNRKLQKNPDKVKTQLQYMIKRGTFGDTMIHGIAEGYDPYASVEDFDACLGVLKEFENEIAIGTMLETGCYNSRFAAAKLTAKEDTPSKKTYLLELDPESQRYAGELSLLLPDAGKYTVLVNDAPVAPAKGIFKAQTGDTIVIAKK